MTFAATGIRRSAALIALILFLLAAPSEAQTLLYSPPGSWGMMPTRGEPWIDPKWDGRLGSDLPCAAKDRRGRWKCVSVLEAGNTNGPAYCANGMMRDITLTTSGGTWQYWPVSPPPKPFFEKCKPRGGSPKTPAQD